MEASDTMYKKEGFCNFMLTDNDKLKALYSSDLGFFLEKAGLKSPFDRGEIKCNYCGITISEKNLYAFIPNCDHFDFCCTKPECVLSLSQEAGK